MKRRDLISGSLAIATLAAAHPGRNAFASEDRPLRLGVMGTGDRGSGLIRLMKDNPLFDIRACCDVLDFRLKPAIESAGSQARAYSDMSELLRDDAVEAVIIATPFHLHADHLSAVLDSGRHAYLEKTAVMGWDGIDRVGKLNVDNQRIVQVGYQWRHFAVYQRVVDLVRAGEIGQIAQIDCQWNRNGDWRRPVPSQDLERTINWRMYREYSGGLAAELSSHQMDFCNWLLGERPVSVMGTGGIDYWNDGRDTRDNIHLIVNYPGGVKTTFSCLTSNAHKGYRIKILGSEGTIEMTFGEAWIYYEDPEKTLGDVDAVSSATVVAGGVKGQPIHVTSHDASGQALLNFRSAVVEGGPVLSTLEDGLATSRTVQASLDAMDQNISVKIT